MTKEQEILKHMELLGISREEAEQLWEDDHSEEVLPEVAEMERKAKKIKRYEKSDKPRKPSSKERKVDPDKKHLINCIRVLLEGLHAEVEPLTNERDLHFTYNGASFSIILTRHRAPKQQALFLWAVRRGMLYTTTNRNFHCITSWQFCQAKVEKSFFYFFPKKY